MPDDYFNGMVPKIAAANPDEVLAVAKKYLDAEALTVVVVGDRTKIEKSLRELPAGKDLTVVRFDDEFRLQTAK